MNSYSLWKKQKLHEARTTHLLTVQLKHGLPSTMPALNTLSPTLFAIHVSTAQQKAGWKTRNNNSSTTVSQLWRNAGPSAFQLQDVVTMLKSDKVWCAYVVVNCVSLQTFWTPVIPELVQARLRVAKSIPELAQNMLTELVQVRVTQSSLSVLWATLTWTSKGILPELLQYR